VAPTADRAATAVTVVSVAPPRTALRVMLVPEAMLVAAVGAALLVRAVMVVPATAPTLMAATVVTAEMLATAERPVQVGPG
jgi:hypothetical protein